MIASTATSLPPLPEIKSFRQITFEAYHRDNPTIYTKLVALARLAKQMGRDSYSIKSLFEQLRWNHLITGSRKTFLLNNNNHSFYSRLIMAQEPDLRGFFELRHLNG